MPTIDSRASTPLPEIDLQLATTGDLLTQFHAHHIFPGWDVPVDHGVMPIDLADRRVYNVKRDSQGNLQRIATEISNTTFTCEEHGIEAPLFDSEVNVYRTKERGQLVKARQSLLTLLTAREISAAALLAAASKTTTGADVTLAGTKALNILAEAVQTLADRLGVDSSTLDLTINSKLYRELSRNAQVVDEVKALPAYSGLGDSAVPAVIPGSAMAAVLGIRKVNIARGKKDSANRAKASSLASIWSETEAYVHYSPQADAATLNPGFGYLFLWDAGLDRGALSAAADLAPMPELFVRTDMYREESKTADIIRTREYNDMLVTNNDACQRITGLS